jgi:hypothetical protein
MSSGLSKSLNMIKEVATALNKLNEEFIYVGGAVIEIYLDSASAPKIRPTEDVDCVIKLDSRLENKKLDEKLRGIKFQNDSSRGAPICRWIYLGIKVDIMATDDKILGFSNEWYEEGVKNNEIYTIEDQDVLIMKLPWFLACKIVAFNNRGAADIYMSKDLEDIVALIENAKDLDQKLSLGDGKVLDFIKNELIALYEDVDKAPVMRSFLSDNSIENIERFEGRLGLITGNLS